MEFCAVDGVMVLIVGEGACVVSCSFEIALQLGGFKLLLDSGGAVN